MRKTNTPPPEYYEKRSTFNLNSILILFLILLIVGIGVFVYIKLPAVFTIKDNYEQSSENVAFNLANIGELATQAGYFTNVQVVEDVKEIWGINVPGTHKKAIYSYDGIVKAGFDFADIKLDVNKLTKKITVTLPDVRILSCELDEDSFKVYDQKNGAFNKLNLDDFNSTNARMKREVESKAKSYGILTNAKNNAENMISAMIYSAYPSTEYTVEFK